MEPAEEGKSTESTVCVAGVGFYKWECGEAGVVGLPAHSTVISIHGLGLGLGVIYCCAYLP